MASDDMPDAAFTHTVRGFFGEELTIVAYAPVDAEDGGAVEFLIRAGHGKTASAHVSSPAERESFARAWMEACRRADGSAPVMATPGQPATAPADADIQVRSVTLWLCDLCLDGAGGECHVPGCSLWINRAPDMPLRGSQSVTVHPDVMEAIEPYDELADAASAVDAARDAREAWNDPDGGDSRDVQ